MLRRILALALAGATVAASAQVTTADPDWKELDAPPPPALRTQGLIPLEVQGTSLRFGVDPASVTVGADAIVRYVVVATSSSGTTNAMYEGVRCSTGEVKVYARHNPDTGWVPARQSEWQALNATANSRYSLQVARMGACMGRSPNGPAVQIVRDLRAPPDTKFLGSGNSR
jgi:hypothetical protein